MACYCGTQKKVETPKPMLKDPVMLQTIKVDKTDNENLSTSDSSQPNQNCSSRPQRTGSPQHKPTGSPQPQRTGSPQPQLTNQIQIDDTDAGRQIEEIGDKTENVNCSSGNTVTHAENQEKELKELEANDTGEAGHLSTLDDTETEESAMYALANADNHCENMKQTKQRQRTVLFRARDMLLEFTEFN